MKPDDPAPTQAVRIGGATPLTPAAATQGPVMTPAAAQPAAVAQPAAQPAPATLGPAMPRRGGAAGVIIFLLVAIALLGGAAAAGWYFYLPSHPMPGLSRFKLPFAPNAGPASSAVAVKAAPPAPGPAAAPAVSSQLMAESATPPAGELSAQPAVSSAAAMAMTQPVQQQAAALVTDAQRAGLPRDQIAALAAANDRIGLAANQAVPGAPVQSAQAGALALTMARAEGARIARLTAPRAREVEDMLGQAAVGYDALSAVRRTNAVLTRAISATQSRDPITAIQGARRAVAAYPAFNSAYAEATHYYAPAKRAAFWPLVAEGRGLANQVAGIAADAKAGGLFATTGRREAYQEMQDNAARAQGLVQRLNAIAEAERAESDLGRLDANYAAAASVRQSLSNLYAVSDRLWRANK
jgi:hypothetical protein